MTWFTNKRIPEVRGAPVPAVDDGAPKTAASVDHLTKAAAIDMLRDRGVEDPAWHGDEVAHVMVPPSASASPPMCRSNAGPR